MIQALIPAFLSVPYVLSMEITENTNQKKFKSFKCKI